MYFFICRLCPTHMRWIKRYMQNWIYPFRNLLTSEEKIYIAGADTIRTVASFSVEKRAM